jgi:Family of unknown function (DUF6352)
MVEAAPDFWLTSGFHLLRRDATGKLVVTDEFLRAYLARPEMRPVEESCDAERALHAALMADPRQPVGAATLARLADADARENYAVLLRFRDALLAHDTIEACYLAQVRDGVAIAPLFLGQLAHVILRNILDGCADPLRVRAAELLFRAQMVKIEDGSIKLADEEIVEMYAARQNVAAPANLLPEAGGRAREIALDVLGRETAMVYWERSDRFDTVLEVGFTQPGLDALCRVLEAWLAHFLGVAAAIHPVQEVRDERWSWHVGLDSESTAILNDLYNGAEVDEARRRRLLSLFRLEFRDAGDARLALAGKPVYLGMAMTANNKLYLKPQNLLVNLPLARGV